MTRISGWLRSVHAATYARNFRKSLRTPRRSDSLSEVRGRRRRLTVRPAGFPARRRAGWPAPGRPTPPRHRRLAPRLRPDPAGTGPGAVAFRVARRGPRPEDSFAAPPLGQAAAGWRQSGRAGEAATLRSRAPFVRGTR